MAAWLPKGRNLMKNIFFLQKNCLYKNFTRTILVLITFLFILKNQSKSVNLVSVSTLKPVLINFPNPFTDFTYIFVSLPQKPQEIGLSQNLSLKEQVGLDYNSGKENGVIELKIFDLFGNVVRSYELGFVEELSGKTFFITWDGKDSNGNKVARGGYICVLYYNNIKVIRKIGFAK